MVFLDSTLKSTSLRYYNHQIQFKYLIIDRSITGNHYSTLNNYETNHFPVTILLFHRETL